MALTVDFSRLDAMDILDIAIAIEDEACDHYQQLAGWMQARKNPDVTRFFEAMAGREKRHRERLEQRRSALYGDQPARHSRTAPWEVEAPDYDALKKTLTLREAYELSLDMEIRAHDYYSEALEYISDPEVAELLEGLRRAEVEHQRAIREHMAQSLGSDP
jgi:rubrerythrin